MHTHSPLVCVHYTCFDLHPSCTLILEDRTQAALLLPSSVTQASGQSTNSHLSSRNHRIHRIHLMAEDSTSTPPARDASNPVTAYAPPTPPSPHLAPLFPPLPPPSPPHLAPLFPPLPSLSPPRLTPLRFSSAISTTPLPLPHISFAYEVTFHLTHPHLITLSKTKPPLHFHPYQREYIRVIQGRLGVEVGGVEMVLGVGDGLGGEVCVERWVGHRLYPPTRVEGGEVVGVGVKKGEKEGREGKGGEGAKEGEGEEGEITKFWLWGEETQEAYQLDTVYFQNWYGYQDEVVRKGGGMDLMQVLCVSASLPLFLHLPFPSSLLPFSFPPSSQLRSRKRD